MFILRWSIGIVRTVLNAVAGIIVFAILATIVVVIIGAIRGDGVPGNAVLELDLRSPMEDKSASAVLPFAGDRLSIMDVVFTLDAAARDSRVKGVLLRAGSGDLSQPKGEELRDALSRFQRAGKFVIAHSQSFYSGSLGDYVAVSGADQIWMQPVSTFFGAGESSATPFLKGLFDKIDAVPQFVQRYEYKNAANIFTETDYTPAHREASMRVLQSWYDSAVSETAASRHLDARAVAAAFDQNPAMAEVAKQKGLITNIGYEDEARSAARSKAGAASRMFDFARYRQATRYRGAGFGAAEIALIHAAGDITEGKANTGLAGGTGITGDTYADAIRDAAARRNVKAILLRIDSPGGSAIASDQILHALKLARAAGKPIIVSMGSVAASGGYFIAMAADRIVAEPGTLTGSIGVLWGKVAAGKTAQLIGVNIRELSAGKNANFLSAITPWDASQLDSVNAQADAVYADFTQKVAEGRKMPLSQVQQVARGRVWTGADAKERGLVDELGGFWQAVDDAKKLAGIAPQTEVVFRPYPRAEGLFGTVSRLAESSSLALQVLNRVSLLLDSPTVHVLLDAVRSAPVTGAEFRATGLPE